MISIFSELSEMKEKEVVSKMGAASFSLHQEVWLLKTSIILL
jgi:hypothetical protein